MRGRRGFLATLTFVVLLAGLAGSGAMSGAAEPVKIAVFSVTGPAAFLGGPERNTLEALVEQVNKAGGIRGARVDLVVYDDASDTSKAVLATRRLIEQDRVLAIVGPSTSNNALAVLPFAGRSKVPLLAIAVHKEISTPVKPWVFQVANVIDQEIGKILDYLKKHNVSRFTIINVSDARGVSGRDALVRQAPAYGMTVSVIQAFGPDDTEIQRVQVKSVQIFEMPAPARVADALRIDQGGPVTIMRRMRFLENGPFALTTNYIRVEYGRRLREGDLYRFPLVQIFELGVVFGDAIQTIEAKFATDEVAGLLEVPFGAPILHVERVMRDEAGAPVEVVMSCYRADRYRYKATLVRGRGEPSRWQYKSHV